MTVTKTISCIVCPRGCRLEVVIGDSAATVTGNACVRGEEWGRQEATEPLRTLTTTVAVSGGIRRRVPVRSSGDLPLARLLDAMNLLDSVVLEAPVQAGFIVVANILGLGLDMVTTDSVPGLTLDVGAKLVSSNSID